MLGRICLYFVKHRGFKSSRKAGAKDKEEGVLLSATQYNSSQMSEKGYRTVGEMLYKDSRFFTLKENNGKIEKIYRIRNKSGQYENTFLRTDIEHEIKIILDTQIKHGVINSDFKDKYIAIFNSQRSFDEGPGAGGEKDNKYSGVFAVGDCSFEKGEKRAPKSSYTVEYTVALEKLNNLKVIDRGEELEITQEMREGIIKEIKNKKEIKYDKVKKLWNLPESAKFNLLSYSKSKDKNPETSVFVSMKKSYEIRACLREQNAENIELLDKIAQVISMTKSIDNQREAFLKNKDFASLTEDEIAKLSAVESVKFSNVSLLARKKLLPYLEAGYKYS